MKIDTDEIDLDLVAKIPDRFQQDYDSWEEAAEDNDWDRETDEIKYFYYNGLSNLFDEDGAWTELDSLSLQVGVHVLNLSRDEGIFCGGADTDDLYGKLTIPHPSEVI